MKYTLWIMQKVFRFCFKYILGLMFVLLLSSGISVGINLLNKNVVNELVQILPQGELSPLFVVLLFAYLFVWLVSKFLGILQAFANNLFRLKVDVFMHKLFMQKSIETPQERFFDTSFWEKYSYVNQNTNKASSFIFKIFSMVFGNVSVIVSAIVIFVIHEPLLLLYVLLVMVFCSISTVISTNLQYKLSKRQIKEERKLNYLSGLFSDKQVAKEMRIFGFAEQILSKWKCNREIYLKEKIKITDKATSYNMCVDILNLLLRFTSIFIIIWGVQSAKYDIGTFVMLWGLSETCVNTIQSLTRNIFSGFFDEARYFHDFYQLVFPLSNKDIEKMSIMRPVKFTELCAGEFQKLEAKNVTFTYPNSKCKAVDDVCFRINKGEIVSILGYNGSGKTTLSKLLCGAYTPDNGTIFINGHPIEEFSKNDVFCYFGTAPQEYSTFSVSMKEFVGLGRIEIMCEKEAVQSAYEKANVEKFFNQFPKKDETIIGKSYDPEGIDVSGGEMQKLVIASAYMGEPEILILDEPTASIDPMKEIELLHNFRTVLNGKTAILISHRIGFARLADKIVVMEKGKIIETGTHQELIDQNGCYAEMFNMQKELYH